VRARPGTPTERRTLFALAGQLERSGQWAAAAAVRTRRLAQLDRKDAIVHEVARLCEAYEQLGRLDLVADAAARALHHDPTDVPMREVLDRALAALGRHDERVRQWVVEASSNRPSPRRIDAYRR